eukprot:6196879-Pyramimonas_sp.AAC.1
MPPIPPRRQLAELPVGLDTDMRHPRRFGGGIQFSSVVERLNKGLMAVFEPYLPVKVGVAGRRDGSHVDAEVELVRHVVLVKQHGPRLRVHRARCGPKQEQKQTNAMADPPALREHLFEPRTTHRSAPPQTRPSAHSWSRGAYTFPMRSIM